MDEVVLSVQAQIRGRDWDALRLRLHPYLHWTQASGQVIRGRQKVLDWLAKSDPPALPSRVELRDGQIYRWTS